MEQVHTPSCWMEYYPRPQLKRESFYCLNGQWTLNGNSILVPYPPQSPLSGYDGPVEDTLRYEKRFQLPDGFLPEDHRLILHFGAVDQFADVSLNGSPVAHHEGGYLPFSADVTEQIREGENLLEVIAVDTLSHDYPYGKQTKKPHGMWYTPVSGIWQSVWMEAVPKKRIHSIRITPDLSGITLEVLSDFDTYTVEIPLENGVFSHTFSSNKSRITLSNPHLWTPEDPFLYSISVKSGADMVESYFALRTVEIKPINKAERICLNGQPLFLHGVLDQGYFMDGIFLPESPEGFDRDVLAMKELGLNLLRKHIKIEPAAFYYACDKYGMLVLQDMVNNGSYNWLLDTALPNIGLQKRPDRNAASPREREIFQKHTLDTLDYLYHFPSIIGYTIFNEGWGQFDSDRMYELCKKTDPSRFYDSTSGWFPQKKSDLDSRHVYFKNKKLSSVNGRPLLLSECGGYTRLIEGHLFKPDASYGYGTAESEEALMEKLYALYDQMVIPSMPDGLCGCIYTQVSDVEEEVNGLYTYDRACCKVPISGMQELADKLHLAFSNAL
ncbi:MAG: glycoside hydrolase family 2 [Oscillospiraceae bacterium]|nr:glycoside hydrolase family 2 [Oscillospiraceae bacterium]